MLVEDSLLRVSRSSSSNNRFKWYGSRIINDVLPTLSRFDGRNKASRTMAGQDGAERGGVWLDTPRDDDGGEAMS